MFKPFVTFLCAFVLASIVLAQEFELGIIKPKPGATVLAGSEVDVRVAEETSVPCPTNVSMVIGIFLCTSEDGGEPVCPSTSDETLGEVLFKGPFEPSHDGGDGPYQDILVGIPEVIGLTQLGIKYSFNEDGHQVVRYTNTELSVVITV